MMAHSSFNASVPIDVYNNTDYMYQGTNVTYVCDEGYVMTTNGNDVLSEVVIQCQEQMHHVHHHSYVERLDWSSTHAYCKRE